MVDITVKTVDLENVCSRFSVTGRSGESAVRVGLSGCGRGGRDGRKKVPESNTSQDTPVRRDLPSLKQRTECKRGVTELFIKRGLQEGEEQGWSRWRGRNLSPVSAPKGTPEAWKRSRDVVGLSPSAAVVQAM